MLQSPLEELLRGYFEPMVRKPFLVRLYHGFLLLISNIPHLLARQEHLATFSPRVSSYPSGRIKPARRPGVGCIDSGKCGDSIEEIVLVQIEATVNAAEQHLQRGT